MAEETNSADKFALLSSKVERESRFTRSLVVICTVANIGVSFYALTQTFSTLPAVVWATFMSNLDKTHTQWSAYEMIRERANASNAPASKSEGKSAEK